ncbi:MAG: glycosyltransferase [Candidatus Aureabacteria bacterium]|nr:glycosyltransferase [Candidatus Auribacterota bacterium]
MKSIIFIEPYASLGGHMYKNLHCLEKKIREQDISYQFIAEKNIRLPSGRHILPALRSSIQLQEEPDNVQTEIRKNEYRDLIASRSHTMFVFLTAFQNELQIVHQFLQDPSFRESLIKKENKLVFHITTPSFHLFNIITACKKELSELQNNLFFSFFSRLQTWVIKNQWETPNAFTLFASGYEDLRYANQSRHMKEKWLSCLGRFQTVKCPHLILEGFQKFKKNPFHVHFYPINELNFGLYSAFMKNKKSSDRIVCQPMKPKEYQNAIFQTKVGLLPYDSRHYSIQASGPLEEYLFAGVPVIVPKESWLSYFAEKFDAGYVNYDETVPKDFETQLEKLLNNYDHYKQKSLLAADKIFQERNTGCFVKILQNIGENKVSGIELSPEKAQQLKPILNKGCCRLYTLFAEECFRKGESQRAHLFLKKALSYDQNDWKTRCVINEMQHQDKSILFLNKLINSHLIHNPYDFIEEWKKINSTNIGQIQTEILNPVLEQWKDFISLQDIPFMLDRLKHKIILSMQDRLLTCVNNFRSLPEALIKTGEWMEKHHQKDWKKFYQKAVLLLKKKKTKSDLDLYRLASALQKMGKDNESNLWFNRVIRNSDNTQLKSGSYFHLGNGAMEKMRLKKAVDFFLDCLSCNPFHQKAKEYLQTSVMELRKLLEGLKKGRHAKDLLNYIQRASELNLLIPPEIKNDELYFAIQKLSKESKLSHVLEIGSSSGGGSTEAFVNGLRENPSHPQLYCMEVSKVRFQELSNRYKTESFVHCLHASSVPVLKFPSEEKVKAFYYSLSKNESVYPLDKILGWLKQDIEYVRQSKVSDNGIQRIKEENHIEYFDMVLIDGSEFLGEAELEEVYGAGIILLDDINGYKNYKNRQRLLNDPQYTLLAENRKVRNGYAIFKRKNVSISSVMT